jgi:hypothetical protein
MSLWNTLMGWLRSGPDMDSTESGGLGCGLSDVHGCGINPATGLPMVGGCGGVDVEGNPFGTDLHNESWSDMSSGLSDDTWSSPSFDTSPGWEDSWTGSSWDE